MRYLLVTFLLINGLTSFSQTDFKLIDAYASVAPKTAATSIPALAAYLQRGAKKDIEKARIIFSWIAYNIKYDDDGFNTGNYQSTVPDSVLKNKVTVCSGYAGLYTAIGMAMGLNVKTISGCAKGFGYKKNGEKLRTNHDWNVVMVDNKWHLIDVTWGSVNADNVAGKAVSKQGYNDYWFDTDPYEFLFTHYPEEEKWTLIAQHVTSTLYTQLPYMDDAIFKLGFDARTILGKQMLNNLPTLPQAYSSKYHLKVINFPLNETLAAAPEYTFVIQCSEAVDIAFINNNEWHHMYNTGHQYVIKMPLQKGTLEIAVKGKTGAENYSSILKYKVGTG